MKTTFFDGPSFARQKKDSLRQKVDELRSRGIVPKLATILVGEDPASRLYVTLKKKAVEEIGGRVEIFEVGRGKMTSYIIGLIRALNKDVKVHGIMIQLPLPAKFNQQKGRILENILPRKDVDGLRTKSPFLPATVKAILQIIEVAKGTGKKVVVVGSKGEVGGRLIKELKKREFVVEGYDKKTKNLGAKTLGADILVSATGTPGLITGQMVKKGVVAIDVGAPKGDLVLNGVALKASFVTPVPGGVGPVTIASLLENLVEAAYNLG